MSTARSVAAGLSHLTIGQPQVRKRLFASLSLKKFTLCLGDLTLINIALFLALMLRDLWLPVASGQTKHFLVSSQFLAFNILHGTWLFVFYSVGLYDIERFESRRELAKRIVLGVFICGVIGLLLFHILGYLKMTPKMFRMPSRTALSLDLTFLTVLLYVSRELFMNWGEKGAQIRVMLCGNGAELTQFREFIDHHRHLGYQVCDSLPLENTGEEALSSLQHSIQARFTDKRIDLIAVSRRFANQQSMQVFFYRLLCSGAHVVDLSHLYEEVTGKIPSSLINEAWFVGTVREFNRRGFEMVKRLLDLAVVLVLGIPTIIILPWVALAIKADSPGPIVFRQSRVGKDGYIFNVLKFRTMVDGAESNGARWAIQSDSRITRVGAFLRRTRIDELPQLWSVLRGEMSLVGPRPERPEFMGELNERIPFFEARNLVRPGLTGWAQINFGYGASVEDAHEKLQYDLYYIKHRSISLDLSILLKTCSTMLRYEGR